MSCAILKILSSTLQRVNILIFRLNSTNGYGVTRFYIMKRNLSQITYPKFSKGVSHSWWLENLRTNSYHKATSHPVLLDEESALSHWKLGDVFSSAHSSMSKHIHQGKTVSVPVIPDFSTTMVSTPKSSITCSSGQSQSQQCSSNSKTCQFNGCGKEGRGASGLCIAHGSGRRCQKSGCPKGAEERTVYCKAHGGGRWCQHLGCTKRAERRTDFCIAHEGQYSRLLTV